jgi:nicotinamidase-related amidase
MTYVGRDEFYEEPLADRSAMWTDLYELTMAQALWAENRHEQQSTFHAFVRRTPYEGAYLLTAGQNIILEWLDKNWKFTDRDIARLAAKEVVDPNSGQLVKVFQPGFLEMLKNAKCNISLDAMPEGEIAFAGEPIYKVSGPIWQCLAVETAILNVMNSQSNFATYATILKNVANGKPVLEFGLRRAQAIGGLEPTRGAFVGGADGSSNCLAESYYGIPTKGTMAHVIVDVQRAFCDPEYDWRGTKETVATAKHISRIAAAFRKHNIPTYIVYMTHGDPAEIACGGFHEFQPEPSDILMPKKTISAFESGPLRNELLYNKNCHQNAGYERHIDTILLSGFNASACVRETAIDARAYDFDTYVMKDCVGNDLLNESFGRKTLNEYEARMVDDKGVRLVHSTAVLKAVENFHHPEPSAPKKRF